MVGVVYYRIGVFLITCIECIFVVVCLLGISPLYLTGFVMICAISFTLLVCLPLFLHVLFCFVFLIFSRKFWLVLLYFSETELCCMALQLWQTTLKTAPVMVPQLMNLFPHLVAVMERSFDHLQVRPCGVLNLPSFLKQRFRAMDEN